MIPMRISLHLKFHIPSNVTLLFSFADLCLQIKIYVFN